jgi:hypothetical protein
VAAAAAAIAYRRCPTRVMAQGSLPLLSPATAAAALSPFLLLWFACYSPQHKQSAAAARHKHASKSYTEHSIAAVAVALLSTYNHTHKWQQHAVTVEAFDRRAHANSLSGRFETRRLPLHSPFLAVGLLAPPTPLPLPFKPPPHTGPARCHCCRLRDFLLSFQVNMK